MAFRFTVIKNFDKPHLFLLTGALFCLLPFISAPIALIAGIVGTLLFNKATNLDFNKLSRIFLMVSIVLMGFGMSWKEAVASSSSGFFLTALSVSLTLIIGFLIGKLLKVDGKTTLLITAGTAICGGSAIAAVSPIIQAKNQQLSFALIVIFVLNAVALIVFPVVGQFLGLSQELFGNWAAIAIHDTTSVVGAGEAYGNEALQIATTVKLTRALWIIPMVLMLSIFGSTGKLKKIKVPWFILLFILAMITAHQFPQGVEAFAVLDWLGRRGMVIALFLIGSSISLSKMRDAGLKPFFLGASLWVVVSIGSLYLLNQFY